MKGKKAAAKNEHQEPNSETAEHEQFEIYDRYREQTAEEKENSDTESFKSSVHVDEVTN